MQDTTLTIENVLEEYQQETARANKEKMARISAEIKKKKEQIEKLRRRQKTEEAKEKERLRKERNRRLIITGANIEKLLGFAPDMCVLLGLLNRSRHYFQKPLSSEAEAVQKDGEKIIAAFEAANKRNKQNGTE